MPPLALRCRDGFAGIVVSASRATAASPEVSGFFASSPSRASKSCPVSSFPARAEDPPHEQFDLFAQQPDLLRLSRVLPAQGLVLIGEAGFQWRRLGHGNVVFLTTTPAIVQVIG
jgi:hypothetical protein